jgi:uncharacterized protein
MGRVTYKRALVYIACAAFAIYLAFLALLFFTQRSFIYPGVRTPVAAVPPRAPGLEILRVPIGSGETEALFLPAAPRARPTPVVIFAHGNGEVTDFWVSALDGFRARGIGVLLVEYPGYGRSGGSPSEASIRAALSGAYDRIASDPRVDRTRIFGYGQSLGGGAICLLARDRPLAAMILQSTFTSLAAFTSRYWAPSFLLRDRFDNLASVTGFAGPILVIHGRQDQLIPWSQGERLARASARATFKLYDCGHGCWDPDHLPFWSDADRFLEHAGLIESGSDSP